MTETRFYVCSIVITMKLSALWFFLCPYVQNYSNISRIKEWEECDRKHAFFDEAAGRLIEVQRKSPVPIWKADYEGAVPVKIYFVDGTTRELKWN